MKTFAILNFPAAKLKLELKDHKPYVLDLIRKKWLLLTPEEWVRQHVIHYLTHDKNYPPSLISLETGLKYNNLKKRSDILVYNNSGKPLLLIECKSTDIEISQKVIDQVCIYNKSLGANYLCITNGLKHYCWTTDKETGEFNFLSEIPGFKELAS